MRDVLTDIQAQLKAGAYRNEEHVRLSLVSRILQQLGWDIWNPLEFNTEYVVVPNEDRTKVDIALFANMLAPTAFIEIKAVGQVRSHLRETEVQLRNYNRNNTALFSIITDGQEWRFYYSQTGGEFPEKLFRVINVLDDRLDEVEQSLVMFLGRSNIDSGLAKQEAESYLQSSKLKRAIADCLPQARHSVNEYPYPSLPESLAALLKQRGFNISKEEALMYLRDTNDKPLTQTSPASSQSHISISQTLNTSIPRIRTAAATITSNVKRLSLDNLGDLRFANIKVGRFGDERGSDWRDLLNIGMRRAVQQGLQLPDLVSFLKVNLKEGNHSEQGFSLIPQTSISMQGMNTTQTAANIISLAKMLQCEIYVFFEWSKKSPFAGQQGLIEWKP